MIFEKSAGPYFKRSKNLAYHQAVVGLMQYIFSYKKNRQMLPILFQLND